MSGYWLVFVLACVACGAVPFVAHWERSRDEADREWFAEWFGGGR